MDDRPAILPSLFPAGWQEMALQSGVFERLREFSSPGVLLRTLLLHVARGYSLRETAVRAKLAHWADVSDALATEADVSEVLPLALFAVVVILLTAMPGVVPIPTAAIPT